MGQLTVHKFDFLTKKSLNQEGYIWQIRINSQEICRKWAFVRGLGGKDEGWNLEPVNFISFCFLPSTNEDPMNLMVHCTCYMPTLDRLSLNNLRELHLKEISGV